MSDKRIIIVGAGPSGLTTAINLRQAGIDNFILLERSDDVGGTWHTNRYPGLACDVPSLLYSFRYEQKGDWSEAYAPQPEIKRYMREIAEKYDLIDHIRFHTEVVGATWSEADSRWKVKLKEGPDVEGEILVSALGMFNEVRSPDIPGLADFGGSVVRTSDWPADADFDGKRVAIIGSAASAVQCAPFVAAEAEQLHVYQRTPNWILPKEDEVFAEADLEARRQDPSIALAMRKEIFDFFEYWLTWEDKDLYEEFRQKGLDNIESVEDPKLREKLTPKLPFAAQRVLFSNTYYPMFNEDHVELVTDGIERVTETGIVTADGVEREVDAIILATGYNAHKFLSVLDVKGRDGRDLRTDWKDGAEAYKGIAVSGYPNLFMLYGPNTNQGSLLLMIEYQAEAIARQIEFLCREEVDWMDVRREAQDAYNESVQADIERVGIWAEVGSKYYRASSGKVVTQWPLNMAAYAAVLETDDLDDYELSNAPANLQVTAGGGHEPSAR